MREEPRLLDLNTPSGVIPSRLITIRAAEFAKWRIECLRKRDPEKVKWHEEHYEEFAKTATDLLKLHCTFTNNVRMGGVFMKIEESGETQAVSVRRTGTRILTDEQADQYVNTRRAQQDSAGRSE